MVGSTKQHAWQSFVDWCTARGLCPAPANPWTLAAYVRFLEADLRPDTIRRRIGQIGQMHFEKHRKRPDRDPLVLRTMENVKKNAEKPPSAEATPPLFNDEDFLEAPKKPRRAARKDRPEPGRRSLRAEPKLVRRKRV